VDSQVIRFLPELSRIRAFPALVIRSSYEKGDNSIEALQKGSMSVAALIDPFS
jgi:hypothetical protein